jgi:hypothetical protein
LSPVSTRPASAVAGSKSRHGEEAIETVCYKTCASLVIQVQMMPARQLFVTEG